MFDYNCNCRYQLPLRHLWQKKPFLLCIHDRETSMKIRHEYKQDGFFVALHELEDWLNYVALFPNVCDITWNFEVMTLVIELSG